MEDWAYAAGWDVAAVAPCTPTINGGYDRARTDYAALGKLDALRAFNLLVCMCAACMSGPPCRHLGSASRSLVKRVR
jgi:hypothetical protein